MKTSFILFVYFCFIFSGCASISEQIQPQAVSIDNTAVTPFEKQLGEQVYAAASRSYGFEINPRYQKQLTDILRKLLPSVHRPNISYRIFVLDSPEENALVAPDGAIYFTRGMIDLLGADDLIAATLAHELAHVSLKHSLHQFKRTEYRSQEDRVRGAFISYMFSLVTAGMFELNANGVQLILDRQYSFAEEYEADVVGAYYLENADYDPALMIELLDRIHSLKGSKPIYFTTHPSHKARKENVENFIQNQL